MTLRGKHDVGGLEITMQEAALVSFLQRFSNFDGHREHLGEAHLFVLEPLVEIFSGDVLHHKKKRPVRFGDLEYLADVGVIERCGSHGFAPQAFVRVKIACHGAGQNFERYLAVEAGVAGAIHHAHAAFTQAVEDLVCAKFVARRNVHGAD